jgi:hypothetical protein
MTRITDKHVQAACDEYNRANIGHLIWADIKGDGMGYKPRLYAILRPNDPASGVTYSDLNGRTRRETINNIRAAIACDKLPDYAVIIRAIHERGISQRIAFAELSRRGLWLNDEQKRMAGIGE